MTPLVASIRHIGNVTVSKASPRRVFDFYPLEDRILLSADGLEPSDAAPDADAQMLESLIHQLDQAGTIETQSLDADWLDPADAENTSDGEAHLETRRRLEIVFVDSRVDDSETLLGNLSDDARSDTELLIVRLAANADGIEQISASLGEHSNIDAIHLLSHSDGNSIQLGATRLDEQSLLGYAGDVAGWADSLADDADLLIYGCDLASTQSGRSLIDSLAQLCDCDVAASDDATGHTDLGGDWELEHQIGSIETLTAFTYWSHSDWQGLLATETFQEGVSGYASTQDTELESDSPDNVQPNGTAVRLVAGGDPEQGLIRFEDIFGAGAGEIPIGATINSATLEINVYVDGTPSTVVSIHEMLENWTESATWNSMSTSGAGIQTDDVEAAATATDVLNSGEFGSTGWKSFDVTSSLQSWSSGGTNYGWVIVSDDPTDGVIYRTSDYSTISVRPRLTVDYTASNQDPTITSDGGGSTASINVAENNTTVTTVTASDGDGDTPTFTITGGADQGLFSVDFNSGVLTFDTAPDFEAPVGGDNSYEVIVTASDGNGGTDDQTITVTVTDVNESPTLAANNGLTVSEGSTGNLLGTADLNSSDPDDNASGLIYTITDTTDNGTLFLSGVGSLGLNDTFSQADIDAGNVSYDHNDSETTSDSFSFSLADGGEDGSTSVVGTFNLSITLVNDNAPVANDDAYTVDEDGTLVANWWDTDWTRRQVLTFDNSAQGSNLDDFPVLVVLNSGNIDYGQTQNDGSDLRFLADDGTVLAYDIEEWNEGGNSYVWVRVPQIAAGSNSDSITMYYGNTSAGAGSDPGTTWTNGFLAVQHLNDDFDDPTAFENDGINSGSASESGQVADGQRFDGSNDFINLGSDASLDDLFAGGATVSAWINPAGWGENGYGRIFDKSNTTYPSAGWALELSSPTDSLLFQVGHSGNIGSWFSPTNSINLNTWQHISVSYDSSSTSNQPTFYINGIAVSTVVDANPSGTASTDASLDLHVGNHSQATSRTFDGVIDDVRLSDGIRSSDWIRAQYLNTSGSFVSFGGEQATPADTGVLVNDSDVDGDSLTVSLVAGPANAASFVLNSDGSFTYDPIGNFSGSDSFTYRVNDGTNDSNIATVNITVNAINDDPTNTGTLPSDLITTEDINSAIDLSGIDLNDVDENGGTMTLTLSTSSGGNLNAGNGGGVTVAGSGTDTLVLSGSLTDLNTYLDNSSNIGYLHGTPHSFGNDADTITVVVNDGGNSGSGGGTDQSLGTINIDISAVNDEQVLATNTGTTVAEGSTGNAITTAMLETTDVDNSDAQLIYTVDSAPTNGTLFNNGSALSATDSFTQADLDAGLISYDHDGSQTAVDSFGFTVDDGAGSTSSGTFNLTISNINDAPTVSSIEVSALNYNENDGATAITSALALNDVDDANLESAVVQITGNYVNGEDVLAFTDQNGISGSWDSATGTLSLTGTASVADYQAALRSITYNNVSDNPSTSTRTVSFAVNDGDVDSNTQTRDITFNAINDDPTNSGSLPGDIAVTEDVSGNVDLSSINLSDLDHNGGNLTLTLSTSTGGNLSATGAGGVTVGGSGTDTLSLSGSLSNLNTYLDNTSNITYLHSTPNTFGNDADTIAVVVNDGGNTGSGGGTDQPLGTVNIDITAVNDEQVIATNTGTTVAEGSTGNVIFNSMLRTTDVDNTTAQLVYTVDTAPVNGTLFRGAVALAATDTFTQADLDAGLISYDHDGSSTLSDSFDFTVDDGTGTTSTATFNWTINAVNDAPVTSGIELSAIAYDENDGPVSITAALSLSDSDDTDLESAFVQITGNYSNGEDVLSFVDQNGISGTWDPGLGRLSLVGTASLADYESALRSITYSNTSDNPSTLTRTIAFTVNDGDVNSNTQMRDVTIASINDDPSASGLPTDVVVSEDIASDLNLSSINLADLDAGTSDLTLTLSTSTGGNLLASSLGGVTVGGSGTGTLTLVGSTSDLNAFLDTPANIRYLHTTPDAFGNDYDTVTLTVNDGGNTGSGGGADVILGSANIDITAVNDAPGLVNNTGTTVSEGTAANPITSSMLDSADIDDSPSGLTYTLTDNVDNGTLNLAGFGTLGLGDSFTQADVDGGNVTYDHDDSETTSDSFDFLLADGGEDGAGAVAGTFSISVLPVNDHNVGPISDVDVAINSVDENSALGTTVGFTALAIDLDAADSVSYSLDDSAGARFAIDSTTGVVTVSGALDFETSSSHNITIRAASTDGSSSTLVVAVAIGDVNEAPDASGETFTVQPGQTLNVGGAGLIFNDSDVDGDSIAVILVTPPTDGTLSLLPGGTFTYTPNPSFYGQDSFFYQLTDGSLTSNTVEVTIEVPFVALPPSSPDPPGQSDPLDPPTDPPEQSESPDQSDSPEQSEQSEQSESVRADPSRQKQPWPHRAAQRPHRLRHRPKRAGRQEAKRTPPSTHDWSAWVSQSTNRSSSHCSVNRICPLDLSPRSHQSLSNSNESSDKTLNKQSSGHNGKTRRARNLLH